MKESLRLNIPVPCTEDWEKMMPEEKGRHCQQCCKTVVDFTGMTDGDVLRYFKQRDAGGICGRFVADQLGRELAPAPVQRNGMKGWPLVVAGALALGQGPEGREAGPQMERGQDVLQVGPRKRKVGLDADTSAWSVRDTPDTILMGKMAVPDPVVEMPADTVTGVPAKKLKDRELSGLVSISRDTTMCIRKPMDTVSRVKAVVDTVVSILKDTVAAVVPGFRPIAPGSQQRDLLNVYPNPVLRGGMMRLAWRGEAGSYSVALLDLHGQISQERLIEVGGKGQVDEWTLPNGLAAGVYFLRVTERSEVQRPGEKVYTVEVLVQ